MADQFPVYVTVGSEQVRIGTATRQGDGFSLEFEGLSIGGSPSAPRAAAAPARRAASAAPSGGGGGDGMIFPPYGRSKGMPISGASMQDLEFYANGSRRSLADASKSRWHDKEKQLLAAIEAEIARQRGDDPGPSDDGVPPPGDEDAPF